MRRLVLPCVLVVLVLGAAPGASGGFGCRSPMSDAVGPAVEMSSNCFVPTVVRIAEGETVTWSNADQIEHNVFSTGFPEWSKNLGPGDTFVTEFDNAGVYPYVCTLHPGMVGAVVVEAPAGTEHITTTTVQPVAVPGNPPTTEAPPSSVVAAPEPTRAEDTFQLGSATAGLAIGLLIAVAVGALARRHPG